MSELAVEPGLPSASEIWENTRQSFSALHRRFQKVREEWQDRHQWEPRPASEVTIGTEAISGINEHLAYQERLQNLGGTTLSHVRSIREYTRGFYDRVSVAVAMGPEAAMGSMSMMRWRRPRVVRRSRSDSLPPVTSGAHSATPEAAAQTNRRRKVGKALGALAGLAVLGGAAYLAYRGVSGGSGNHTSALPCPNGIPRPEHGSAVTACTTTAPSPKNTVPPTTSPSPSPHSGGETGAPSIGGHGRTPNGSSGHAGAHGSGVKPPVRPPRSPQVLPIRYHLPKATPCGDKIHLNTPWAWAAERFGTAHAMERLRGLGALAARHGHKVRWITGGELPCGAGRAQILVVDGHTSNAYIDTVLAKYATV